MEVQSKAMSSDQQNIWCFYFSLTDINLAFVPTFLLIVENNLQIQVNSISSSFKERLSGYIQSPLNFPLDSKSNT